jgi:hypothetical protein
VLEYGMQDGDTLSELVDGYAVTLSTTETANASASSYTLSVQVIDTASGEYISDLALSLVPQDPTTTLIIEGDPGAWRITGYRGGSGNPPSLVAIVTIAGDTRVAVGLGFGWVTEWSAS